MAALRRAVKLATLAATVCAAGIVSVQSAEASWPGGNGKIVFYRAAPSPTGTTAQIYSVNSDGRDQTNLSAAGGGASQLDAQPTVSPNGKRIAFVRADPSTFSGQIWTMNINGSDQTDISNDAAVTSEAGPAFTEDGSQILFLRQPAGTPIFGGGGAIWIRSANGGGTPRQVTPGPFDANPAMSPDGDLLAFSRPVPASPPLFGPRHLLVMKADGSSAPTDLGPGAKPDWSPDSTHILYGQAGTGPIMIVKVSDPSDKQTLPGPADQLHEAPAWSPDATKIVFMDCSPITFLCHIGVMSASGQDQHDITNDQNATDQKPAWQPVNRHGDEGQH